MIAAGVGLRGEELGHGGFPRTPVPADPRGAFKEQCFLGKIRVFQAEASIGCEAISPGVGGDFGQVVEAFFEQGLSDAPSGNAARNPEHREEGFFIVSLQAGSQHGVAQLPPLQPIGIDQIFAASGFGLFGQPQAEAVGEQALRFVEHQPQVGEGQRPVGFGRERLRPRARVGGEPRAVPQGFGRRVVAGAHASRLGGPVCTKGLRAESVERMVEDKALVSTPVASARHRLRPGWGCRLIDSFEQIGQGGRGRTFFAVLVRMAPVRQDQALLAGEDGQEQAMSIGIARRGIAGGRLEDQRMPCGTFVGPWEHAVIEPGHHHHPRRDTGMLPQIGHGDAPVAATARLAQCGEFLGDQAQVGRCLEAQVRVGGPTQGFEDVAVEGRRMGGCVADPGGEAIPDDRAECLIPVGKGLRPGRAPEVTGLRQFGGESGQASQEDQSEAAGPLEGHGGLRPSGGDHHGIASAFGHQPAQAQAAQGPEEVPPGLRDVLIVATMFGGETPTELGVFEPLDQRGAVAVGVVQIEAIGDQRVFEEFLDLVQGESALQAFQQLQQRRGERRGHQATTGRQTERQACLGSAPERRLDQRGLFPWIGQQDEDFLVSEVIQFLKGLQDAVAADLQFTQGGVRGMDGDRSIVWGERETLFGGHRGGRTAGGLQSPEEGIRRERTFEIHPAIADRHERVGQLALEVLRGAPEGPQQAARRE